MANLRDIRNRTDSIQNTQQITRAMKMVAAAKLRKAQNRIEAARPYAVKMQEVVARLAGAAIEEGYDLLEQREEVKNVLFIIVSSDRGLAGGFNNNLFKVVEKQIDEEFSDYQRNGNFSLLTIGKKATKHYGKRDYKISESYPGFFDSIEFGKTSDLIKSVISAFKKGDFDEVYLAYNEFKSVIAQNRKIEKVLPVDPETLDTGKQEIEFIDYIYEPDAASILEELLPLHVKIQLWRAILESNAAEQGARMTAMDSATENAKELEDDLRLEYNRARQSAITTEISEIISGAQALSEA